MSASGLTGGGQDRGAGRSGCRGTRGLRQLRSRRRRVACRGSAERPASGRRAGHVRGGRCGPSLCSCAGKNKAAADHQRVLLDRRSLLGSPLCSCAVETERPPTGQIALARAATPACSGAPLGPRHVSSGTSDEAFGGGGGTDHPPPWPGVARHPVRFRRDRGCVSSFSIPTHSAGADVITDHGAEHIAFVQRIPALTIPQLVVSIFSSIRIFLCFLGSPSSAAPEKKKEKISCSTFSQQCLRLFVLGVALSACFRVSLSSGEEHACIGRRACFQSRMHVH